MKILLQKPGNKWSFESVSLFPMSQMFILKYANSWTLPKPRLSFTSFKKPFFRVSIQCCYASGLLILFGFWNFSWYASFNMVNWLDLIFINLLTFTFWTFRLFLNKVLTPPLPSYILRPMSSQCMNILYVQQQNIPNHCLFAWLIASFLALDRRGRTVSENFRFSLCESRHNEKIKILRGHFLILVILWYC